MAAANLIILADGDNVGIALADIAAGSRARTVAGRGLEALEAIPQGHKIALGDIPAGALIMRLGMPVAVATAPIPMGRLVHVHNVASRYLNNDEDHYE
ncbi:UxaA family hydrolase [Labrys wisconsinensis]|uniref:RecA/RadA family phage recombinase n=1 Tax=Labrys wisconsinensis TaxID=425677 RepID=A0ABU0JJN7_9HYPH|nr:UxaA family hydrolase [Labrys wisconsinensis]MDQ0474502.1 putative RecA/RadA family phage recombinase [Labrys wisconsinensis]